MKDRVEIGHLTKFDAFRVNKQQLNWTLNHDSKSLTNVSRFTVISLKQNGQYIFVQTLCTD